MNPERKLFGRVNFGPNQVDLGRATIDKLAVRLIEQYRKSKYQGEPLSILVEIHSNPLPPTTIMSREQQLLHEFANIPLTPDDEEIYPGITMGRAMEIMNSDIGQQYNEIRNPDKRVGLGNDYVTQIRRCFDEQFGEDGQTVLPWIES